MDAGGQENQRDHVVLCGFGRVGSTIGLAFDHFGISYTVIERDPDIVRHLRRRGMSCLYGDASHPELLQASGADQAALMVVALPGAQEATLTLRRLRAINEKAPILARAHGEREANDLMEVGATEVIQPEIEAAHTLIRHALQALAVPKPRTLAYLEAARARMSS
jgi:CPA2 family monovalent cation:H+ antiporter-2